MDEHKYTGELWQNYFNRFSFLIPLFYSLFHCILSQFIFGFVHFVPFFTRADTLAGMWNDNLFIKEICLRWIWLGQRPFANTWNRLRQLLSPHIAIWLVRTLPFGTKKENKKYMFLSRSERCFNHRNIIEWFISNSSHFIMFGTEWIHNIDRLAVKKVIKLMFSISFYWKIDYFKSAEAPIRTMLMFMCRFCVSMCRLSRPSHRCASEMIFLVWRWWPSLV